MIIAQKVVITYAKVAVQGDWCDYRVWPSGQVEVWTDYGDEFGQFGWESYHSYEDNYEAIQTAGLEALK